ncbi:MAG: LysM domain-containing protein, partial [Bacteroidota bacterium]
GGGQTLGSQGSPPHQSVGSKSLALIHQYQPPRADSFIEGFQNTVFGVVGAVASGAYIIGSTGIGMAAGGGLALTLSIGEIGIGVAQMIDALKNDAPANVSEAIKSTSTLPGMAVYPFDKEAASIVDAGSQFVVGTLTGGNFKTLMENPAKIRGAFTEEGFALLSADSKEVAKLAYDVLSFTDAAMDTRGLGQAQAQMVDGIIHSTINGLSEFATPVTPEENILSHDYFYSKFISDRSNSPYPTSAIHRVVSGETLTSIARLYGTTVENIAVQNNIKNRNVIHVGQRLNFQLTTPSVNQNNNQ